MDPYTRLNDEHIEILQKIFTPERVLFGEAIAEEYGHDELSGMISMPQAVVQPLSAAEVSKLLSFASEQRIPVTPRGQGTGLVGGCVPVCGGIILDMSKMNHILELDMDNLTLTVEPGVLLMDVAKFVEERQLFYPPDPGEKSASIGGNISTNAGGMRAVKYGVTRDYIRGLEVVLPNGAMINLSGKVAKNSSGYDFKDLIIGSEGTLAVVTKAILKLLPFPAETISLLIPFADLETAISTVPLILQSRTNPVAVEFFERETIMAAEDFLGKHFPDHSAPAYLLLSFDGNSLAEIEHVYEAAADICLDNGALDVLIADTTERKESIWSARSAFLEGIKAAAGEIDECDVVVPRKSVAEFMQFAHSLEAEYGVSMRGFGHAGDGNLHIYAMRENMQESAWQKGKKAAMEALYRQAALYEGQVSGEHGIGWEKQDYLLERLGETQISLMRAVKQVFDPSCILNPQKIFRIK
ncbi:MAG TPA: FAD-binding oxidoreductase [Bacillota bacterium]|nr:FAD-binding oxidoreductase [Bacillota bacterium]